MVHEGSEGVIIGLEGPSGGLVEVGESARRSGRGREAHPKDWERLGGPPKGLLWVGRSTWCSWRVQEADPEVRDGL